jgi:hypothetical protein
MRETETRQHCNQRAITRRWLTVTAAELVQLSRLGLSVARRSMRVALVREVALQTLNAQKARHEKAQVQLYLLQTASPPSPACCSSDPNQSGNLGVARFLDDPWRRKRCANQRDASKHDVSSRPLPEFYLEIQESGASGTPE